MNFTVQTIFIKPVGGRMSSTAQVVADSKEQAVAMIVASRGRFNVREFCTKQIKTLHPGFYTLTMEMIQSEKSWNENFTKMKGN